MIVNIDLICQFLHVYLQVYNMYMWPWITKPVIRVIFLIDWFKHMKAE